MYMYDYIIINHWLKLNPMLNVDLNVLRVIFASKH